MADLAQQGDVLLVQSLDGGEIILEDGLVQMNGDLNTSIYLALFGGNIEDTGADNDPNEYWGNALETDANFKYRSETQYILRSLPPTSFNLSRLQQAAVRDMQYLINIGVAESVDAVATIPELNKLNLECSIVLTDGSVETFTFTEPWSN